MKIMNDLLQFHYLCKKFLIDKNKLGLYLSHRDAVDLLIYSGNALREIEYLKGKEIYEFKIIDITDLITSIEVL